MNEQIIEDLLDMSPYERAKYIEELSKILAKKEAERKRKTGYINVSHMQEKSFEIKWYELICEGVKMAARNAWGWVREKCLIM